MILVDTCVLLDLFTADPQWLSWSKEQLETHASQGLAISDIAFAELSPVSPRLKKDCAYWERCGFP